MIFIYKDGGLPRPATERISFMKKFLLYFSVLHGMIHLSLLTLLALGIMGYTDWGIRIYHWLSLWQQGIAAILSDVLDIWLLYGLVRDLFHLNRDNIVRVIGILCNSLFIIFWLGAMISR